MGIPKFATIEIDDTPCPADNCDAMVILPSSTMKELRRNHNSFYCYRGHPMSFGHDSDIEKLKKQLEKKEELLQRQIKRTEWAKEAEKQTEYKRRAIKGQLTKVKNRIKNGVCPCCNRSFANMAKHMANQHPNYTKDD